MRKSFLFFSWSYLDASHSSESGSRKMILELGKIWGTVSRRPTSGRKISHVEAAFFPLQCINKLSSFKPPEIKACDWFNLNHNFHNTQWIPMANQFRLKGYEHIEKVLKPHRQYCPSASCLFSYFSQNKAKCSLVSVLYHYFNYVFVQINCKQQTQTAHCCVPKKIQSQRLLLCFPGQRRGWRGNWLLFSTW